MSATFHLALEGGKLEKTLSFYVDVLGCKLDMKEEGRWQDIDFWGNELTLHESVPRISCLANNHEVDMGNVLVPHFGIHLNQEDYNRVKQSVADSVGFIDPPYVRFKGTEYEQETFFVCDPNYNILEIKSLYAKK